MNLNEALLNPAKGNKMPVMGPPISARAPKPRSRSCLSSGRTSDWGRSHESVKLNSSSSKTTTETEEEKIVVAITEGRGEARCEVGIAAVNVSRPLLMLCQTSDSQSYTNTLTKLNIINPHIIIYPATFEATGNRLICEIRKQFPNKKIVGFLRKAFNKGNALDKLYKICIPNSIPILMMIKNRYYALAAASGLLTYLQDSLYIYLATSSIKLDYQASEGYAIIDIATADRLELVCSNQPAQANKYSSLFGIMNRCLTRVGTRHLRTIILQPLYSSRKIDERLDCVEELIRKTDILLSIQGVLPKLSGVDQLLSLSTLVPEDPQRCSNRQINYILLLNGVVDAIEPLNEALKHATQPFFVNLRQILCNEDFKTIKNLIRETIHEDAYSAKGQQANQQRIWAIKPGINGLLDLVRKTFSERIEDMREYVKRLSTKYDLALTLASNNKKGYHIKMSLNQNQRMHMKSSDLPNEFIQVFRLANSFTMKTAELVNLSTRIDDILKDLFTLSNLTIHDTIVKIKQYAALFYQLVEGVSYLDVLQSLAEASHANSWIRPKFAEYTDVSSGHHPLLDFLCQKTPISNPMAACEHYNFHIITGPNGAGKSIFIRQVMLLQIMAQAGCFVPAQTATFRTADKMFARISNDDDMESNASSFVLEMTEVNYILTTMTDRSLIIIDELCRSTSVEEGTAIAMQICETLAKSKAFTWVTTHFLLLTKLADLFFNIKVWQLQTVPIGDTRNPKELKLNFKFSLTPGVTTVRGYGIYMVRGIWPEEVLRQVDELLESYVKKSNEPQFPSINQRARLRYELDCKLDKLKLGKRFTLAQLNKLINEYNQEMQKFGHRDCEYSQNIINQFQEISKDGVIELDHSIFDDFTQESENNKYLSKTQQDFEIKQESFLFENLNSQESVEIPLASEAKRRMQEVFTPNTVLDTSSQYSINNYFNLLPNMEPEIILDYNSSQCSLNLTQKAMENEENVNVDDNQIDHQDVDFTQKNDEIISCSSQISSNDLSQKLQIIREQQEMDKNLFQPPPNTPQQVPESPFISTFARPLQEDARKTSTPLINSKIQPDAKCFGDSSSISKWQAGDVTHVTTSKVSFSLPRCAEEEIDIASTVEILESFVEEIQNNNENDICNKEEIYPKIKHLDIYPNVRIIEGPYTKSEESMDISSNNDDNHTVRPIIRNIKLSPIKQMEPEINKKSNNDLDKLIEAFDNMESTLILVENTENKQLDIKINVPVEKQTLIEQEKNIEEELQENNNLEKNEDEMEVDKTQINTTNSIEESISYSPLVPREEDSRAEIIINKAEEDLELNKEATRKIENNQARIEEIIEISSDDDEQETLKNESKNNNNDYSLIIKEEPKLITHQFYSTDIEESTEKFFTPNDLSITNQDVIVISDDKEPSKKIDIISEIRIIRKELNKEPINVHKRKLPKKFTPLKKLKSSTQSSDSKKSSDSKNGISEASKLRNLDGEFTTTSTSSDPKKTQISTSQSDASKQKSESGTNVKKKVTKFITPFKKNSSGNREAEESSLSKKKSFIYPPKMSQKAIREEFLKQDKQFYESSGSSTELAKIWEERLKRPPRPTPKQIQQTTCLATIRKTHQGVEVIPAEEKIKPRSSENFLKQFVVPQEHSVNMNIFSDRNAKTFDQFIKSDKKDYKAFNFKFGQSIQENFDENLLNFQQVETGFAEYTHGSQSWTFVRRRSDELINNSSSQRSTGCMPFLKSDFHFTPDGLFSKEKEEDIQSLLRKYK